MKKIKPYFIFSTTSLVVAVVLSKLLHFSLANTWQAGVFLLFFFGPYYVFAFKQATANRKSHPLVFAFLVYCLTVFSVGSILIAVLYFNGIF